MKKHFASVLAVLVSLTVSAALADAQTQRPAIPEEGGEEESLNQAGRASNRCWQSEKFSTARNKLLRRERRSHYVALYYH